MSEQLLTGLGFALLVGGTAFQTWVVLFAGFAFFGPRLPVVTQWLMYQN